MELVSYKRGSINIPSPIYLVKTQAEGTGYELGRSQSSYHAGAIILDIQPPEM